MNQIEIGQTPVKSSINIQKITGSWFPTGYYGHFRAKSQADVCNYFRQLAQPNPPEKFLYRQNSEATSHMFSQHDNRFKFENDPLVRGTQAGFGRRKAQKNLRGEFDPYFIGWVPANVDRKNYIDDIKTTSYANDYNKNLTSSQILSNVQTMNSLPSSKISAYAAVYNHGQPDKQLSKKIRQETFQRYSTTQTRRSQLQRNEQSINVASCLVWNNAGSENNETTKVNETTKMNENVKINETTKINENMKMNETTKIDDKMMKIVAPITSKSRNNFHGMPAINQQKLQKSQSMQMLKINEQPRFGATTSQEHHNVKVISPPRAHTSCEETHANSVECLISKYM